MTRQELSEGVGDAHADSAALGISPPTGLSVHRFTLGSEEYVALSFPVTSASQESEAAFRLTPSEHEILALLVEGRSNSEIARMRQKSPRTIANQVASIYRKLGVGSRRELRARLSSAGPIV